MRRRCPGTHGGRQSPRRGDPTWPVLRHGSAVPRRGLPDHADNDVLLRSPHVQARAGPVLLALQDLAAGQVEHRADAGGHRVRRPNSTAVRTGDRSARLANKVRVACQREGGQPSRGQLHSPDRRGLPGILTQATAAACALRWNRSGQVAVAAGQQLGYISAPDRSGTGYLIEGCAGVDYASVVGVLRRDPSPKGTG